MTIKDVVRAHIRECGVPPQEEWEALYAYLDTLEDVLADSGLRDIAMRTPVEVIAHDHRGPMAKVRVAEACHMPAALDSVSWEVAKAQYRNALRVSATGNPARQPAGAIKVDSDPSAYGEAWLDPKLLTPQQAISLGVAAPPMLTPVPADVRAEAPPTPTAMTPEAKDARAKKLKAMIDQDAGRLSLSRRFLKNEAAGLLSESAE